MTDDLLKAATQALREETDDAEADGRFTRARVMASLHQGKVKRRTRLAFILPLAACLAAGTAWGAATGRLPAMFHAISEAVSHTAKAPPEEKPKAQRAPARAPAPLGVPAPVAPPVVEVPSPAVAAPEPAKAAPSSSAKAAPSSSASFQDTDGDLYRLAHEAHFASHDYARALSGWDAYLRAAPRGRLATEARYNRAICLLRLGRNNEARLALSPFASGKMGYRQNEAQLLLEELGAEPLPAASP
jgi:TolA-binding protein